MDNEREQPQRRQQQAVEDGENRRRHQQQRHQQRQERRQQHQQQQANQAPREIPERYRIQDFESWLQMNALPPPEGGIDDTEGRREEIARFEEERRYQERLHSKCFVETDEEKEERQRKQRLIDAWKSLELDIHAEDGTVIVAPLSPMAESCDTVFVLALSWHKGCFAEAVTKRKKPSLSLDSHEPCSIVHFVDLVLGKLRVTDLPSEVVVDCLRIAHYLQNAALLDEIAFILQNSIDSANAYSISQLADQLNLPTLLERSLSHMMDSIGNVVDDDQVAEYLTPELQDRIKAIQTAIQSSIHSQRSRLYFSSLEEYLAIFAERVQYYRERLAQAKEQQQQLLLEDQERQARSGRFVTVHLISSSKNWKDAQAKIEKQEARLKTLEVAYTEQKKLFARSANSSNDGNGNTDSSSKRIRGSGDHASDKEHDVTN